MWPLVAVWQEWKGDALPYLLPFRARVAARSGPGETPLLRPSFGKHSLTARSPTSVSDDLSSDNFSAALMR